MGRIKKRINVVNKYFVYNLKRSLRISENIVEIQVLVYYMAKKKMLQYFGSISESKPWG